MSRFVKHLVSSSPRLLLRPPPSPSPPLYCPSALSVTQTTRILDLVATTFSFSTASSSPSLSSSDGPAVEPSSPSYLSVRIRCPKDVAVSFTSLGTLDFFEDRKRRNFQVASCCALFVSLFFFSFSCSYLSLKSNSLMFLASKLGQDVLSEALLCFGASSASMDEEDGSESPDEVAPPQVLRNKYHLLVESSQIHSLNSTRFHSSLLHWVSNCTDSIW